jgi:hypothetical protein
MRRNRLQRHTRPVTSATSGRALHRCRGRA